VRPNPALHLTGAALLVSRYTTPLQAAPAGELGRSASDETFHARPLGRSEGKGVVPALARRARPREVPREPSGLSGAGQGRQHMAQSAPARGSRSDPGDPAGQV